MGKNNNPYPKMIHDEDSNTEVLNQKWVAWEEGYQIGRRQWGYTFVAVFLISVVIVWYLFFIMATPTVEPHTIYRDFYITRVVTEEVIKEVPVEVVKSVSVPVPIEYKEWQSLDQLHDMGQNITTFQPSICLQTAENIQQIALEQGYPVSIALTQYGNYYGQHVTEAPGGHAGLLVEVKGDWYFIDPLPWKVTKLW